MFLEINSEYAYVQFLIIQKNIKYSLNNFAIMAAIGDNTGIKNNRSTRFRFLKVERFLIYLETKVYEINTEYRFLLFLRKCSKDSNSSPKSLSIALYSTKLFL